jgi:cell wall-associated NlpC family hydrolase
MPKGRGLFVTEHRTRSRIIRGLTAIAAASALAVAGLLAGPTASANPADRIKQVEAYLQTLEMEAAAAHGRVHDAEFALDQLNDKISRTEKRVQQAKGTLSDTQSSIGRFAAAAYRTGGVDTSLQLLLADNPQQFLDQAVVLDIVANNQNTALRKSQVARLKLAQATAELDQQRAQAEGVVQDLRDRKAEFDQKVAATQTYLNDLKEEERQRLEEERKRREAASRAAAQAALAAGSSSSSGSGISANGGPNDNGGFSSGGTSSGGSGVSSDRAAIAVAYALAQVGKPYSFAARPPSSWDCTKLTAAAWAQAGVRLTPYSYVQAREVRQIPTSQLQPGDLLFFFKNGSHHASMYIGGGQIVEAASPQSGVRITSVWNPWNVAHFSWAGRPYA